MVSVEKDGLLIWWELDFFQEVRGYDCIAATKPNEYKSWYYKLIRELMLHGY